VLDLTTSGGYFFGIAKIANEVWNSFVVGTVSGGQLSGVNEITENARRIVDSYASFRMFDNNLATQCYSSGSDPIRSMLHRESNPALIDVRTSYWNKDLSGCPSAPSDERSAAAFRDINTFATWDFVDIWRMDLELGRPVLRRSPQ